MKLADINPFIRYSDFSNFKPINDFVKAYDSRLFYLAEGNCGFITENENRHLSSGTLILLSAGTEYRFEVSKEIHMAVLNFDFTRNNCSQCHPIPPTPSNEFDIQKCIERPFFDDCAAFEQALILTNKPQLKDILSDICETNASGQLYCKESAAAKLKLLLCECASLTVSEDGKAHRLAQSVLTYIKSNLENEITNIELGKVFGYHPNYINRVILAQTGVTIKQHILNFRIERAKLLLTSTEMMLSEIAEKCGFKNGAYFSSCFKSRMNISPIQYRRDFSNLI